MFISIVLIVLIKFAYGSDIFSCPDGSFSDVSGQYCFIFKSTPAKVNDAEDHCEKSGGFLASVHDKTTNDIIGAQLQKLGVTTDVWLGGYYCPDTCDAHWGWTDFTEFDFQAFANGQHGNDNEDTWITFNPNNSLWYAQNSKENGNNIKLPYLCKMFNPTITTPKPSHAPCPSGSFPGLDLKDCFVYNTMNLNWDHSTKVCHGLKGKLASIHDAFTNKFLSVQIQNLTSNGATIWLDALSDYACSGNHGCHYFWEWQDDTSFNYSNFDKNDGGPQDTGLTITLTSSDGRWHTTGPAEEHPFLCKVPPL